MNKKFSHFKRSGIIISIMLGKEQKTFYKDPAVLDPK